SVDFANSKITFAAPHGLYTGELLNYSSSGALVVGLKNRGYFAIVVDPNTIQLAETYDDAIHGIARNFKAVSLIQNVTEVKHTDGKVYKYIGTAEGAVLLSTIDYATDPDWQLVDPQPSTFTPDPANNLYLSTFDTTATNGTGTQSFQFAQRVNLFDPTSSSSVHPDADTITIPNHGLHTGDTVYYEVDPTYRVQGQMPVNLSFEP